MAGGRLGRGEAAQWSSGCLLGRRWPLSGPEMGKGNDKEWQSFSVSRGTGEKGARSFSANNGAKQSGAELS